MNTKEIIGGLASEYDDWILWIEKPEVGANAAQIVDEREYVPCTVTKVIACSEYGDEDEYSEACDELISDSTATCTGEIITFDDTFYVEIDATGDTEEYESINFNDVEFC